MVLAGRTTRGVIAPYACIDPSIGGKRAGMLDRKSDIGIGVNEGVRGACA